MGTQLQSNQIKGSHEAAALLLLLIDLIPPMPTFPWTERRRRNRRTTEADLSIAKAVADDTKPSSDVSFLYAHHLYLKKLAPIAFNDFPLQPWGPSPMATFEPQSGRRYWRRGHVSHIAATAGRYAYSAPLGCSVSFDNPESRSTYDVFFEPAVGSPFFIEDFIKLLGEIPYAWELDVRKTANSDRIEAAQEMAHVIIRSYFDDVAYFANTFDDKHRIPDERPQRRTEIKGGVPPDFDSDSTIRDLKL